MQHPRVEREERATNQYLIIGGAPKSATTSLFYYLSDHPQICPANRKETYFFAREFDYKGVCKCDETLEAFSDYFTHCNYSSAWRVEATPYTLYSKNAAQKISTLLPNATVLFILRDPVARLFSDYHFHIQREHVNVNGVFEEFIEKQFRTRGKVVPNLLELGRYVEYLRSFYANFERSKILTIFFEEFKADPMAEMKNLCVALGIDNGFYFNYSFTPQNRTIYVRYARLNRINMQLEPFVASLRARSMHSPRLHRAFEKIVSVGKSIYFPLNNRASDDKETIPSEVMAKLADYYQPYNLALSEELGRPLPWKSLQPNSS